MSQIIVITASDKNFKNFAKKCIESVTILGYNCAVYDLGELGHGRPFDGRISSNTGAKIPCKPFIMKEAMKNISANDILVWLDADVIMWDRIDEISKIDFDVGVTVRRPKSQENDMPINAGVVFIRKSTIANNFVNQWATKCENAYSDQVELNRICSVTSRDIGKTIKRNNTKIHAFPCDIYNNFYFKKPQLHAKIIHYKTKHRFRWPERTIRKDL